MTLLDILNFRYLWSQWNCVAGICISDSETWRSLKKIKRSFCITSVGKLMYFDFSLFKIFNFCQNSHRCGLNKKLKCFKKTFAD
jgi:hypothetical protein